MTKKHFIALADALRATCPVTTPLFSLEETEMKNETVLYGYKAIEYADAHGLALSKYADPIEDAREDLTAAEARQVAREDPNLIYVVIQSGGKLK